MVLFFYYSLCDHSAAALSRCSDLQQLLQKSWFDSGVKWYLGTFESSCMGRSPVTGRVHLLPAASPAPECVRCWQMLWRARRAIKDGYHSSRGAEILLPSAARRSRPLRAPGFHSQQPSCRHAVFWRYISRLDCIVSYGLSLFKNNQAEVS